MCIFLIALANVEDFEKLDGFMFCGDAIAEMSMHELAVQLKNWGGQSELLIKDHTWLQAFAIPLLGHLRSVWTIPWEKTCLVSDRGWSVWISTFVDADPSYTEPACISIGQGSPCRKGVWKTGVQDLSRSALSFVSDPEKAELSGESSRLRCARKVTFDSPFIGEADKVFIVNCRLRVAGDASRPMQVIKMGFKQLHTSLWQARKTERCSHGSTKNDIITIPPSCCTVEGFGKRLADVSERIIACLTAQCSAARWLALVAFTWTLFLRTEEDPEWFQLLLRGQDYCFQCAIDQAACQPGKWFIIL